MNLLPHNTLYSDKNIPELQDILLSFYILQNRIIVKNLFTISIIEEIKQFIKNDYYELMVIFTNNNVFKKDINVESLSQFELFLLSNLSTEHPIKIQKNQLSEVLNFLKKD